MARADTKLKPKRKKLTQKEQSERFRQIARELGCDESEDALDRAFEKIGCAKSFSTPPEKWRKLSEK
jgi:hypothetical protein